MIAALSALGFGLAVPTGASAAQVTPATSPTVSLSPLPSGEVEQVLAGIPLEDLSATQLGEVLAQLPGLSMLPASTSQKALTKTIEHLAAEGGTLGQLTGSPEVISSLKGHLEGLLSLPVLSSLLQGQSLSAVLEDALGSLSSSNVLAGLVGASPAPTQAIEEALAGTNPTKLESLLGGTLTGEPFSEITAGELASELGMSTEQLASDVGTTSSQLPSTATALTAPLTDGKTLGILDALEGLDLGLLTDSENTPEGEGKGGSGSGGSGSGAGSSGAGGSGGSGGSASGAPAGTTVTIDDLVPQDAAATSSGAKSASAKIKLLSRKVRGDRVTLVLEAPAAGRLTLTGRGVHSVAKQVDGAERVTLRTVLMKSAVASVRRHRRLDVKLDASFTATGGQRSSITTRVAFG